MLGLLVAPAAPRPPGLPRPRARVPASGAGADAAASNSAPGGGGDYERFSKRC